MEEARSSAGRPRRRRRRSRQPCIACTASYSISFSSTIAEVRQSMRSRRRKPRLNHSRSRCSRSASITRHAGLARRSFSSSLAHLHQRGGAAGRHVQAAEQLAAQRLDRFLQAREVSRRRIGLVGGRAARHGLGRRRVVARQHVEELLAAALVERLVGVERLARQRMLAYSPLSASSASHSRASQHRPSPSSAAGDVTPPRRPSLRRPAARLRRRRCARGRRGT